MAPLLTKLPSMPHLPPIPPIPSLPSFPPLPLPTPRLLPTPIQPWSTYETATTLVIRGRIQQSEETLHALQTSATATNAGARVVVTLISVYDVFLTETLVQTFTGGIPEPPAFEPTEIISISPTNAASNTGNAFASNSSGSAPISSVSPTGTSADITSQSTTSASSSSSINSGSGSNTSTETGYLETTPHKFPTALVALLLSLFSLLILAGLIFYLQLRTANAAQNPSRRSSQFVWGAFGVTRKRDAKTEDREKPVDPVAEAIRKEEQDRLRKQKRSGMGSFYAPQVRHLVNLLGSKEELRVNVRRDRNRKWAAR
ncbi:hypothetical protein EJ08DRAFT_697022 [Tothia fuscella]|uniref:Uncharacterized protein n=1 Tax=Tothia fuscella TaxID=1048955 RepID=A0A9P4NT86_9PEZI|nr:hypothetical protein EJ08DRAFT_697022 [Tothia fuscella]